MSSFKIGKSNNNNKTLSLDRNDPGLFYPFFFWLEKKKIISTSIKNSLFFKKRKSPCAAEYFLPVNPSSFVPNLFLFCFLSFLPVHQNHKLNVYSEMNKNWNPNSVELLRERERESLIIFRSLILQKASLDYDGALIWLWQWFKLFSSISNKDIAWRMRNKTIFSFSK